MKILAIMTLILLTACSEESVQECPAPTEPTETPIVEPGPLPPVATPIVEPEPEPLPELLAVSPSVYYNISQMWKVRENDRRPQPYILIEAEILYERLNAEQYRTIMDGEDLGTGVNSFALEQYGDLSVTKPQLPVIQIDAIRGDETVRSVPATWVIM